MAIDKMEFFDIVDENDNVIGNISENMQNTVKPAQLRFINIIITNNDDKIIVPKRSATKRLFPNCYDFSVGGHVNSGEDYEEAAYRELKEELGIENVQLKEVAYFSPYESNSHTFQKVYILEYNDKITDYDQNGIDKIYYMTKDEIQKLMKDEPNLFKTDYFMVMDYLLNNHYL